MARVTIDVIDSIAKGDPANVSRLCMHTHTGTHIDAQCHFVEGGTTLDQMDLDHLIGQAEVVDLTNASHEIHRRDLEDHPEIRGCRKVLFKTRNSEQQQGSSEFFEDFVALAPDAAEYLVEIGVQTVGIDYLSVEPFNLPGNGTHKTLLENGLVPIEGLDLSGVEPGSYFLVCLPLKIRGGNGGPGRAVLMEIGEDGTVR
jgi:arylformamidase